MFAIGSLTESALQFVLAGLSDCCYSNAHECKRAEVMPGASAGCYYVLYQVKLEGGERNISRC